MLDDILNKREELSNLVHGRRKGYRRFDKRFELLKTLFPSDVLVEKDGLRGLTDDILYLRNQQRHGNLRRATQRVSNSVPNERVDSVIDSMQEKRNKSYQEFYGKSIEREILDKSISDVIDGKDGKFYLEDKLNEIQSRVNGFSDRVCSLNDLDELEYTLNRIEKNSYMKKKAEKNSELRGLRKETIKKLKSYISKNKEHYFSEKKSQWLGRVAHGALAAASFVLPFLMDHAEEKPTEPVAQVEIAPENFIMNNKPVMFGNKRVEFAEIEDVPDSRSSYDAELMEESGKNVVTEFVGDGDNNLYDVVIPHESELSSLGAAREECFSGTRVRYLFGNNQRNITIRAGRRNYEIDANRIFSEKGIINDFENRYGIRWEKLNKGVKEGIIMSCLAVGNKLIEGYRGKAIFALHENTPNGYGIRSYKKGPFSKFAEKVNIAKGENPDNFFYVNTREFYDALKERRMNVILQNNQRVYDGLDDGSLSCAATRAGIAYVNSEVRIGDVEEQRRRIRIVNELLTEMPELASYERELLVAQR